jgi:predicted Fe-Mo cluster-binding NifX family protein
VKIAVTSTGPTLDAVVETQFGRCAYFLCIDLDMDALEAVSNPNITLDGDAGPQWANLLADEGVSVVLTGNCGYNAFQTFGASGIQVITGVSGCVRDAIKLFKADRSKPAYTPLVQGCFCTGASGAGRRMGMGRGGGK